MIDKHDIHNAVVRSVGDCPITNVYFQILRSQLRSHSDAGLFLTLLSNR